MSKFMTKHLPVESNGQRYDPVTIDVENRECRAIIVMMARMGFTFTRYDCVETCELWREGQNVYEWIAQTKLDYMTPFVPHRWTYLDLTMIMRSAMEALEKHAVADFAKQIQKMI